MCARWLATLGCGGALLGLYLAPRACYGITDGLDARESVTAGGEWLSYNKSLNGQRFSLLDQINTRNAQTLQEVCRVEIGERSAFEAGPVVVAGRMFVTAGDVTMALDPVTCAVRWTHKYRSEEVGRFPVNRGVAQLNGRVFRGTKDARVIALDAASGQELWSSTAGEGRLGEFISGAPLAWNGLVFVGLAAGDFGIKGRIVAFDAATGRQVWRFNTVPTGKERGADSWANTRWAEHGGGGSWSSFALDPGSEEIFVPVGNPTPDFSPQDRPGANLFTDSVVVLDALTGKLKWWYQLAPHDGHDWDLGAAPLLYRNTRGRALVAAAGKDGYLHVVDRLTHRLVFKVPTTTVDAAPASPNGAGAKVCPGMFGGTQWNGPAFDPLQKSLFTGAVDLCTLFVSSPGQEPVPGDLAYGGSWRITAQPPTGWISAFDSDSGAVRWKFHTEAPVVAALTATAGGIVMTGDNAGNFLVFDSSAGKLLKKIQTGGAISGGIVTYLVDGRQYVAVTSGSIATTGFGASGAPSMIILQADLPAAVVRSATADPRRGMQIYQQSCAPCHGSDGDGVQGFDLKNVGSRMRREQLVAWIKNPSPPMPKVFAEPLSEASARDIEDVAVYLEQR